MAVLIAKEEISQYKVIPAFVDNSDYWSKQLAYAVRLGNEFKGKTSITFETTQGPVAVETTVWSLSDDYLQLKGGTVLPLKSIIGVHF
jgi:hypothetical protein